MDVIRCNSYSTQLKMNASIVKRSNTSINKGKAYAFVAVNISAIQPTERSAILLVSSNLLGSVYLFSLKPTNDTQYTIKKTFTLTQYNVANTILFIVSVRSVPQ